VEAADEAVVRAELTKLQTAYAAPVVVEALPLDCFYPAEAYHQKYLDKTPGGYCHVSWEEIDWVKTVDLREI
jgi:peptide methionine sulfoxide reductase MsrA